MPDYVMLMKLTEQGAKGIANSPGRIAAAKAAWRELGGEVLSFHVTMGPYDYVAIGSAPNDWAAMAFAAELADAGDVATTTMKAFSEEAWEWTLNASPQAIREGDMAAPIPPIPPRLPRKPGWTAEPQV
jgi:uncharacterized protein with GYD domain